MRFRPTTTTLLLAGVAVCGFAWALIASSAALAMKMNWDTASYVAGFASGQLGWSRAPWNSHYALGPIYWLGHALVTPWGGGYADGVRWLNALALATAGVFVARAAGRLAKDVWAGAACGLVYGFSWGVALLVLSLEDNLLYLPWVTAALGLCITRIDGWRARDSLVAGALVGCGGLVSWQAGLYLFPAIYVAGVLGRSPTGPARGVAIRARDAGLVLAGFVLAVAAWVFFYAATAHDQSLRDLLRILLSRPEPSFFPDSWHDVRLLLTGPRRIFRHLGTGLLQEAGPWFVERSALRSVLPGIGLGFSITLALGLAAATWRARDRKDYHLHFVLVVFVALVAVTSFYVDLPTDKYKRYEFIPLFLTLTSAALYRVMRLGERGRRLRVITVGALLLFALAELGTAITAARSYRASLPTREPARYLGPGTEPWFVYFQNLRARTPEACRYVFTYEELAHGRFQLEIPAGLWDTLPDHLVLGHSEWTSDWRVPVKITPVPEVGMPRACDWWSAAAVLKR